MTRYVALLRAINVGGNHPVKMADLQTLYVSLGLHDVATYIQSGNVVFTHDSDDTLHLQTELEAAFTQRFGFAGDTIIRTAAQVASLLQRTPFASQIDFSPQRTHVMFLRDLPSSTALDDLHRVYVGPETIAIDAQEAFLYYPSGMGQSKLTNALLEKWLKTKGTARNWNTVLKLHTMLQVAG